MQINSLTKDELLYIASVCETAGRFEDMHEVMEIYVLEGHEVSEKERQQFSAAYRQVLGPKRRAWRTLSAIELKPRDREGLSLGTAELKETLARCIRGVAQEALDLVSNRIYSTCISADSRVYFLKFRADLERYMAEISVGNEHASWVHESHRSYKKAADIATCHLKATDAIRLNLMLSFSVFYYEVYNSAERACILAKSAYDDALEEGLFWPRRQGVKESAEHKDAADIVYLLRDHVVRWTGRLSPTRTVPSPPLSMANL